MNTLLITLANFVEGIAVWGGGLASFGAMYQPEKPKCLCKF